MIERNCYPVQALFDDYVSILRYSAESIKSRRSSPADEKASRAKAAALVEALCKKHFSDYTEGVPNKQDRNRFQIDLLQLALSIAKGELEL